MRIFIATCVLAFTTSLAAQTAHHVSGSFEPTMKPVSPADLPDTPTLGRFTGTKTWHGGVEGTSVVDMLTAGTARKDSAGYVAVELVTCKLEGRSGTFELLHQGTLDEGKQSLSITVLKGSGTGELAGITGTLIIHIAPDGKHTYDFDYTLP